MLALILLAAAASPIDEVWALERIYWEAAVRRNDRTYAALWHPDIVGWPCGAKAPVGGPPPAFERDDIRRSYVMEGRAATQAPGMVATFYRLLKEERHPDGHVETAEYNVIHAWVPTPSGWKIISGMCKTPE